MVRWTKLHSTNKGLIPSHSWSPQPSLYSTPTHYIMNPLFSILYSPSSIIHHPSSIIHHPSSILHPPSSILHPPSSILYPPSSILYPLSILHPPSSIHLPSSFLLPIIINVIQFPLISLPPRSGPIQPNEYLYLALYVTYVSGRGSKSERRKGRGYMINYISRWRGKFRGQCWEGIILHHVSLYVDWCLFFFFFFFLLSSGDSVWPNES